MRKWIKKDDSTFKKFNEGRLFLCGQLIIRNDLSLSVASLSWPGFLSIPNFVIIDQNN